MQKSTLLLSAAFALGLAACDSGSSATGSTTDISGANLTSADKAFLAKLGTAADAFGALQKSSQRNNSSGAGALAARSADFGEETCTSPMVTHDEFWLIGDSIVEDGTPGARHYIIDDTTKVYDVATGDEITCDFVTQFGAAKGTRSEFKQAMVEGDLLTTSTFGTYFSRLDTAAKMWEMKFSMKGQVRYNDGFTLLLDSASASFKMYYSDTDADDPDPDDLYYKLSFKGYPYTAVLRYNKADSTLTGDVLRGDARIGTMKVYRDDTMKVLDLDGNPIKP